MITMLIRRKQLMTKLKQTDWYDEAMTIHHYCVICYMIGPESNGCSGEANEGANVQGERKGV